MALDVGCGAAGMALAIARVMTCGRIIAADADPDILDAARAHVHAEWADPRVAIDVVRADLADLPHARRMPYGWTEALRRAGLAPATTRSTLREKPVPLQRADRLAVVAELAHRVDQLRPTMLVQDGDLAAWQRLLDPYDNAWLGHREDLSSIVARSVHIGLCP